MCLDFHHLNIIIKIRYYKLKCKTSGFLILCINALMFELKTYISSNFHRFPKNVQTHYTF